MIAELRHEGGFWSLYVDGQRAIDRESFAVADRVKYYLDHPTAWDHSESCEVAHTIREHMKGGR